MFTSSSLSVGIRRKDLFSNMNICRTVMNLNTSLRQYFCAYIYCHNLLDCFFLYKIAYNTSTALSIVMFYSCFLATLPLDSHSKTSINFNLNGY